MKKTVVIFILTAFFSFSAGEISFKKQREKEMNKEIEVIQNTDYTKENNQKLIKSNERILREKIISIAKKKLGSPYLWGASGSKEFDCSSFVQYVYKNATGINLPRVSYQQAQFKPKINSVRKGDLLFFETLGKGRISHVGIYIGNNKFIHASSAYSKVTISEFSGFYKEKFRWAISVV